MLRLLHLSDLHLGFPFLADRGEALLELAAQLCPTAIVVSGDLVEWGESESHWRAAATYLARFSAPLAVVPGNHDIARWNVVRRLVDPLGGFLRHIRAHADAVVRLPEVTLVCLSTPRRWTFELGHVSSAQLAFAAAAFAQGSPTALRAVVMHHGLRQLARFGVRDCVRGARRAVAAFAAMGVDLVLTGHNHYPHVEQLGAPRSFVWSQAGTATTRRLRGRHRANSVSVIEIERATLRVDWYDWTRASATFLPAASTRFARGDVAQ